MFATELVGKLALSRQFFDKPYPVQLVSYKCSFLPPIFSIVSPGEIELTWLTQLHYWLRLRLTGVVKQAYQEQPPPKLPKQAA